MKNATRVILTFFAFVASYYIVYWVPFSLVPDARKIASLPMIVSLLVAVAVSVFLWKKTGQLSNNLASYILLGGIIVGTIGFILGFFGPIIFTPGANQGPLLGIFITGPLGFVLGLIGGGLYWMVKVKKKSSVQDTL